MRKAIISLVVATASLVPVGLWADGMPPEANAATSPGASSANHVTQADLQTDAPDQYTVVKGDTLWGISGRFLKDPWKWPQIWQMNREEVKDPHWIYPGDVIRLDRSGAYPQLSLAEGGVGSAAAMGNVVRLDPRIRVQPLKSAVVSIPGSVIGPFLSQPLVVEADGLANAPSIVATEESRVVASAGDITYADRISAADGVNWQVFRPGVALRDPESGEILGYEAKYLGDARVRRYGNPTTLIITKSRQEINRGDRLVPARETGFPSYVPHAPDKMIKGAIMSVEGGVVEIGQYQIVTLNRGARDGIEVGDVLASYHRGELLGREGHAGAYLDTGWLKGGDIKPNPVVPESPYVAQVDAKTGKIRDGAAIRLPDERNGLVFVFRVFEKMSYAMVMRATRSIYVGDVVQTP
ncbi:MAG: LysM peptidoglycan-binding domain-containing protein [Thermoanaerobaculia bacterium]